MRGALIGCGFFAQNHLNAWRDMRDAWSEIAFHGIFGGLAAAGVTATPTTAPVRVVTGDWMTPL